MENYLNNLNGEGWGMLIALIGMSVFGIAVFVSMIGCWKVFEKAGNEPWLAMIPYFNLFILTKIAGKSFWWTFLLLIPYANVVFWAILCHELAKKFKQPISFSAGLTLLFPIFICILGFGDSEYEKED